MRQSRRYPDSGDWATLLTLAALATGCASTGVPRPFPVPTRSEAPPPSAPPAAPVPGPDRAADVPPGSPERLPPAGSDVPLLQTALTLIGSPYLNGGSTPAGFDCSGFTRWVFAQHGIDLPRESREQFGAGARIDADAVTAGDLVFFSTVARGASHVGIALDDDRFVHAPSTRGVVRVERRSSVYWKKRYVGARRVAFSEAGRQAR